MPIKRICRCDWRNSTRFPIDGIHGRERSGISQANFHSRTSKRHWYSMLQRPSDFGKVGLLGIKNTITS